MGVAGAALGTALAEWVTAALMVFAVSVRSPDAEADRERQLEADAPVRVCRGQDRSAHGF